MLSCFVRCSLKSVLHSKNIIFAWRYVWFFFFSYSSPTVAQMHICILFVGITVFIIQSLWNIDSFGECDFMFADEYLLGLILHESLNHKRNLSFENYFVHIKVWNMN